MKILVTGGCGNMGVHVVGSLIRQGHQVRVLDLDKEGLKQFTEPGVETVFGNIADRDVVRCAVDGTDAVIHLAWSFSENFFELLDIDVKGYRHILDAAIEYGVKHVINATTGVSYGKPMSTPVEETHPHLVEKSRNPDYGLAKLATEELSKIYAEKHGLCANNVMIWYAYGNVIGGRNLRNMVKDAIQKGAIEVPAGTGGSFLQIDDFVNGVMAIISAGVKGELFNLGTVYLTWEDVARLIVEQANPDAKVVAIPVADWKGGVFLADDWNFSTAKAERMLGYRTALSREESIAHLSKALESCVAGVKAGL